MSKSKPDRDWGFIIVMLIIVPAMWVAIAVLQILTFLGRS